MNIDGFKHTVRRQIYNRTIFYQVIKTIEYSSFGY